jgi:hypothetical protein
MKPINWTHHILFVIYALREKYMAKILKFVNIIPIFLFVLLVTKNVGGKPFLFLFIFPSLHRNSSTIFCMFLLKLFYFLYSLQQFLNVKLITIVSNICQKIGSALTSNVKMLKWRYRLMECQTQKCTQILRRGEWVMTLPETYS